MCSGRLPNYYLIGLTVNVNAGASGQQIVACITHIDVLIYLVSDTRVRVTATAESYYPAVD